MESPFVTLAATPPVRAAQARYYGTPSPPPTAAPEPRQPLGPEETEFIAARDSFYLGTVAENGWPYIQHRGGAPGFLRVTGAHTLAFADYRGNRQLLSTGYLAANDRVALFLMDYPQRARLKILGRAQTHDARERPDLVAAVTQPAERRLVERVFTIDVAAFDWNCPKYITPRFTADEIATMVAPLRARIAELEARLKREA